MSRHFGVRLLSLLLLALCAPVLAESTQLYTAKVTGKKPQSRETFVQGLEIHDGDLYVSSGLYKVSALHRYDFTSGKLEKTHKLDAYYFAEGLTVLGDHIYQLTWRNGALLVYSKNNLELERSLSIPGEGWGLTNNGEELIYSDGSATLHFISPETAKPSRTVTVTHKGRPLRFLNELEWIEGAIWANVWTSDQIVVIAPDSGEVTAVVDLRGLLPASERQRGTDVLNGIALDHSDDSIWVTGKRWPWLYQIELIPAVGAEQTHN